MTPTAGPTPMQSPEVASFSLTSDDFKSDEAIPSRFTCDGENVSPSLSWSGEPQNTAAFALIVDDPDAPAGVFTHWVLFNLPASVHSLAQGVPNLERLDDGAVQSRGDARKIGYSGPCPPAGKPHHYRFNLYALDVTLNVPPGATKQQLLDAMRGHVLAQTQLVGTYQRAAR